MFGNLSKRIEVVTPIYAAGAKQRLWETLQVSLRDQREAGVLDAEGKYARRLDRLARKPTETHQTLVNLALARAKL